MKKYKLDKIIVAFLAIAFALFPSFSAFADVGVSLSPMSRRITLNPGDTFNGSVTVVNQVSNNEDLHYEAHAIPFYVNDDYDFIFDVDEAHNDHTLMYQWITLNNEVGILSPGQTTEIEYTINVPYDVPAGGQYAAIRVTNADYVEDEDVLTQNSANVSVKFGTAYLIYADVTGTTTHDGKITDASVPSFLFSGNISGSSLISNSGNVHGIAEYKLQVFPLFSDEELYTNEEDPDRKIILPNRTFYNETAWFDTPAVGIFNVVYTVEFEGVTTQVSKMVIKCPIWLLFIILFVLALIIFGLVIRVKKRKE